jgi:hypothetical protein
MSRTRLLLAMCLVAVSIFNVNAEEENPFKNAKVGDWTAYKVANQMAGMVMDLEMKSTVIKKTDTEATVEVVTKLNTQEFKSQYTVKLDEKYDPRSTGLKDVTMTETGKGEETLTIAGKELKTKWTSYELTGKADNGQAIKSKGKAWVSTEIPLGGLVKSEGEMAGAGKQKMELSGFGKEQ